MKTLLSVFLVACASPAAPVAPVIPDVPTRSAEESQQKFELLLRRGGSLFVLAGSECKTLSVEAEQTSAPTHFVGHIWSVRREGNRLHKFGYGYALTANERTMWLFGPYTESGSESTAMGCANEVTITYGIDRVDADMPYYLSRTGCQDALTRPPELFVAQGCKF